MPRNSIKTPARYRIVIEKAARRLRVFDGRRIVKTYRIVLGFCAAGDKESEGDGRTPEGDFYVFAKNPESRFHLSLAISYPSKKDAERGLAAGLIDEAECDAIVHAIDTGGRPPQKTGLGGEIYIHGGGVDSDWTEGCVALDNGDIEEIFEMIPAGTKVTILK